MKIPELYTFVILFLLFVKHFYVDFINQTMEEVEHKGIWGDWLGFKHSLKHGMVTGIFLVPFVVIYHILSFELWYWIVVGETCIHYVTDYIKMRFGCRDVTNEKFWHQLGLDQLVHYLTYLVIVVVISI